VKGKNGEMSEKPFKVYTPEQAAELLQLSEHTIRSYIKQGKLKAAAFGNRLRISEDHLREFFNSHLINAQDAPNQDNVDLNGDEHKDHKDD
jgi:excisionase family DNA binding protein